MLILITHTQMVVCYILLPPIRNHGQPQWIHINHNQPLSTIVTPVITMKLTSDLQQPSTNTHVCPSPSCFAQEPGLALALGCVIGVPRRTSYLGSPRRFKDCCPWAEGQKPAAHACQHLANMYLAPLIIGLCNVHVWKSSLIPSYVWTTSLIFSYYKGLRHASAAGFSVPQFFEDHLWCFLLCVHNMFPSVALWRNKLLNQELSKNVR